jgi:hypothetical protein
VLVESPGVAVGDVIQEEAKLLLPIHRRDKVARPLV